MKLKRYSEIMRLTEIEEDNGGSTVYGGLTVNEAKTMHNKLHKKNEREIATGWTEFNLKVDLKRTRNQYDGIPLTKVAEVIKEVFDKSEIEYLIKCIGLGYLITCANCGLGVNYGNRKRYCDECKRKRARNRNIIWQKTVGRETHNRLSREYGKRKRQKPQIKH